jgi:hypothetical protein
MAVKQRELQEALHARDTIKLHLSLLESLTSEDDWMFWQRIREAVNRVPKQVPQPVPLQLAMTSAAVAFEALPVSLKLYPDDLVRRIRSMSIGDGVAIYRTFLSRWEWREGEFWWACMHHA